MNKPSANPSSKTAKGKSTAAAAPDKGRTEANYAARQIERKRLSRISAKTVPNAVTEKPGKTLKGKTSRKIQPLFPKMVLGAKQFGVIANLIRSRDPAKSAAELVLVQGKSIAEAARMVQVGEKAVLPQTVNNAVTRFKAAHTRICEAYTPKE